MTQPGTQQSAAGAPAAARFASWAVLELLGHKKIAGYVQEETIAGAAQLRIDVPPTTSRPGYTKYFGAGSLYCLTPVAEELARRAAEEIEAWTDPIPVPLPVQRQIAAVHAPDPRADDGRRDDEDDDLPSDAGVSSTGAGSDSRLTRPEAFRVVLAAFEKLGVAKGVDVSREDLRLTAIEIAGHETVTLRPLRFARVLADMREAKIVRTGRHARGYTVALLEPEPAKVDDVGVDLGPASLVGAPLDASAP